MTIRLRTIFKLLKETFQEWQEDKASQLAAALAYYTVFSVTPLLIIAIAIAGSIFGQEAARGEIVGQIQSLVGRQGAEVIEVGLDNAKCLNKINYIFFSKIVKHFFEIIQ
jgi:membrane protein